MSGEMAEKDASAAGKPATTAFVTFLAGDDDSRNWKGVVGLAMGLGKVGSAYSLVVAVLHDVPEARRSRLISLGCIVREVESPPENHTHLAIADFVANKLRIWEFLEYDSLVYVEPKPVMKASGYGEARIIPTSRCADKAAWPAGELGSQPSPYFNGDTSVLEPSMVTTDAVVHRQGHYMTIPLEDELALSMLSRSPDLNVHLANKASKCPLAEKELPMPPFSNWFAGAKEVIFARKNLPAMATLAASSATAGVVTTAANPAICFGFYAVFITAIAFVTISLREI